MAKPEYKHIYLTHPSSEYSVPVWVSIGKYEKICRNLITKQCSPISLSDKEVRETKRINNGTRTTANIFEGTTCEFFELMKRLLDKDGLHIAYCDMPKAKLRECDGDVLFDIVTPPKKEKPLPYPRFKEIIYKHYPNLPADGVTSNTDLETMAQGLEMRRFTVICDTDELDGEEITSDAYHIVNISRKQDEVGHWTVACCDKLDKKFYFDSFGVSPPNVVRDFLGGHYIGSNPIVQDVEASDCGLRCLFIIWSIQRGITFEDALNQIQA